MTSAVKVAPVIHAVTDSTGHPISNGDTTEDTTVEVKGTSERGKKVDVINNGIVLLSISANPMGQWVARLAGLAPAVYAIHAVSEGQSSPVWRFTVTP